MRLMLLLPILNSTNNSNRISHGSPSSPVLWPSLFLSDKNKRRKRRPPLVTVFRLLLLVPSGEQWDPASTLRTRWAGNVTGPTPRPSLGQNTFWASFRVSARMFSKNNQAAAGLASDRPTFPIRTPISRDHRVLAGNHVECT